jgi:hypothetical protein
VALGLVLVKNAGLGDGVLAANREQHRAAGIDGEIVDPRLDRLEPTGEAVKSLGLPGDGGGRHGVRQCKTLLCPGGRQRHGAVEIGEHDLVGTEKTAVVPKLGVDFVNAGQKTGSGHGGRLGETGGRGASVEGGHEFGSDLVFARPGGIHHTSAQGGGFFHHKGRVESWRGGSGFGAVESVANLGWRGHSLKGNAQAALGGDRINWRHAIAAGAAEIVGVEAVAVDDEHRARRRGDVGHAGSSVAGEVENGAAAVGAGEVVKIALIAEANAQLGAVGIPGTHRQWIAGAMRVE